MATKEVYFDEYCPKCKHYEKVRAKILVMSASKMDGITTLTNRSNLRRKNERFLCL